MNPERLKMLEQYAHEDPNDPFPLYALAIEIAPSDPIRAHHLFDQLLSIHADYLPTYYHAGHFFYESGELEKAITTLELGIQKTKATTDRKALAELENLLEEIR